MTDRGFATLVAFGTAAVTAKAQEDPAHTVRLLESAAIDGTPLATLTDAGDIFGDARVAGSGALSLLISGCLTGSARLQHAGRDLTHALLLSTATVWALKLTVDATRPSGGPHSFPSGLTAAAFTMAGVLGHHFGWRVGLPAYTLAISTGVGRLEDHHHYIADVLFGAGSGLAMSREVIESSRLGSLIDRLAFTPRTVGVALRF